MLKVIEEHYYYNRSGRFCNRGNVKHKNSNIGTFQRQVRISRTVEYVHNQRRR